MKFIPHTRQGSLILSACDEAIRAHSVPADVATQVLSEFEKRIESLENNVDDTVTTKYGKLAAHFFNWLQSCCRDEPLKTNQLEKEVDVESQGLDFPFSTVKSLLLLSNSQNTNYQHYRQARDQYYRDWKKPSGGNGKIDFGIVEATVSEKAKIAVIGDWGTGTDDALYLMETMMKREPGIEVILHLGDIYNTGNPYECTHKFLNPIRENYPDTPVLTIPGNHEYFSLGKGYFELIDKLNSGLPKWKQAASYFCLRSSSNNWQFLGADTGLGSLLHTIQPDLETSEVEWHADKIKSFPGRTVFMTHHEFVSATTVLNSDSNPYVNSKLCGQMGKYLSAIQLWMWGHNHWFIPYKKSLKIPNESFLLQQGQLLGGSAREIVNEYEPHSTFAPTWPYANPGVVELQNGQPILPAMANPPYYNHTYGIIDLATARVDYYQSPAWEGSTKPDGKAPVAAIYSTSIAAPGTSQNA